MKKKQNFRSKTVSYSLYPQTRLDAQNDAFEQVTPALNTVNGRNPAPVDIENRYE